MKAKSKAEMNSTIGVSVRIQRGETDKNSIIGRLISVSNSEFRMVTDAPLKFGELVEMNSYSNDVDIQVEIRGAGKHDQIAGGW